MDNTADKLLLVVDNIDNRLVEHNKDIHSKVC